MEHGRAKLDTIDMTNKKTTLLVGIMVLLWLIISASAVFGQGTAIRSNNGFGTNLTLIGGEVITDVNGANFWEITNLVNGADHNLIFQNVSQGPLGLIGNRLLASTFSSNSFTGTTFESGTPAGIINIGGTPLFATWGLMYRGGRTNALGGTGAQSVVGQGIGTLTIPANTITTNSVFYIQFWGCYTNSSGAGRSTTWTATLGGTGIGVATATLGTATAMASPYDGLRITFESTGVLAAVRCTGILDANGNVAFSMVSTSTTAIDTTSAEAINLTINTGNALAGIRVDEFDVYWNGL